MSFFQAIQAALNKRTGGSKRTPDQLEAAVRQLVSGAITTDGQVIDVFTAAGLKRPDISILSDQFLAEVRGLKHKNVATKRGEELGLTDNEIAFYDALTANESAVQAMGDDKLKLIAAELITQIRKSVTIDWTLRESARAKIRVMVKRILNRYDYLPDLQEEAVKTVLLQAELLCADWAIQSR